MNFLYITGLTDLKISDTLKHSIKTAKNTFITNNSSFIKSLIPHWQIPALGQLEYNFLTCGRPVIYTSGSVLAEEGTHIETINLLREAQAFLTALWMERDCSVNCDNGFAIGTDNPHIHSNSLSLYYSLAKGGTETLTLNQADIESASALSFSTFKGLKEQNKPTHTALQKSTGRINIASYHLQTARAASDLAIRISTYCSFFESLFSTNTVELSHQLAERIAFSLSSDPNERLEIFLKTKKAYNIRSKTVHGDIIPSKDVKNLIETSEHCDNIARKIYKKIITSDDMSRLFEGTNDAIEEHMRKLIFGIITEL
ncbi:HEPN domain-containing protein [Pseudomonas sp. NFACC37-1]|uniref:HEPN domain-containing protein n=1 Tax=Pseudomonas sp. NFACC37-1 TaxID=1566196 RepID=UPI000880B0F1|nr:HEPN domain-containing protein [Pseudomonas sp. NFACC37-1]SCY35042.1 hypothetical protein SAMN03159391_01581 [Pseudomonas sp. NFACC37-1]